MRQDVPAIDDGAGMASFAALAEAIKDPVVIWSSVRDATDEIVDFRYKYVNGAAESTVGIPREDLVGRLMLDVLPSHRELGLFDRYRSVAASGEPAVIDIPWFEEGNVCGAFEASIAPFGDGIVSVARNVTDRVRAERRLTTILDTMHDTVVIIGPDGTDQFANAAMTRVFGHRFEDICGTPTLSRIHPDDRRSVLAARRAIETDAPAGSRFRARLFHADGRAVPAEFALTDLQGDPTVGGIVATIRDLTDEMRAQEQLAASEMTARFLADNATDALLRLDAHRRVVFASPATSALLELRPEDVVGVGFLDLFDDADRERSPKRSTRRSRSVPSPAARSARRGAAHDDLTWVEVTTRPVVVPTDDGYVVEFHVTMQDVTERRATRLALAASELRMRTLVNAAPIGIFEVHVEHGVTYLNPTFCKITGVDEAESAMGHHWLRLVHPADVERVRTAWAAAVPEGRPIHEEFRYIRPDGRTAWVEVDAVPVVDDGGRITSYLGTVDDVTARRELEQARFQAAELFSAAFDNAPTGMMLTSVDGMNPPRLLKANAAYVEMTGRTFEEIVDLDIYGITHPDDLDAVRAGRVSLIAGEIDTHWLEARQRDAMGRWRWYAITRSVVRDADGTIRFMIAQLEDVTERKEASEHAQRLAITDPLTGLSNRRHFLDRLAGAAERRGGDDPARCRVHRSRPLQDRERRARPRGRGSAARGGGGGAHPVGAPR